MLLRRRARKQFDVRIDHDADEFLKSNLGFPIQNFLRLGRIADQQVDLGRPEETLVDGDVVLPVQTGVTEGDLAELGH